MVERLEIQQAGQVVKQKFRGYEVEDARRGKRGVVL